MQPDPDGKPRRRNGAVLRVVGVVVAVALTATAAWLIVTGESQKRIEIGVLVGLWGALIGAYSMFARHRYDPAAGPGTEVGLRAPGDVTSAADAEARRQWEYRLEAMMRRQIQAALAAEVQSLRSEVAAMRSELVEKVGGQIQLERIEITRVIGSDIEALQREVRQLQATRSGVLPAEAAAVPIVAAAEPLHVLEAVEVSVPVADGVPQSEAAARPPGGPVPLADQPTTLIPAVGKPTVGPSPAPNAATSAPEAEAAAAPEVASAPEPAAAAEPQPVPAPDQPARQFNPDDLFATLPRLSPFRDSDVDEGAAAPNGNAPAAPEPADVPAPTAAELAATESAAARARGRHSVNDLPRTGGRRRRRADDDDDVLARVLAREGRH